MLLAYALTRVIHNDYAFFAGYVVLEFVLLATAWNIAGGYAGYVNFGAAGLFGAGAYAAVAVGQAIGVSLVLEVAGAAVVGAVSSLAVALPVGASARHLLFDRHHRRGGDPRIRGAELELCRRRTRSVPAAAGYSAGF